ncbi:MAG: sugar transferase, partial [Armatimonadota bacterium]
MTARPADFSLDSQSISATYPLCKRMADIFVSAVLLLLAAPLLALIALAIRLHDRGPVFFVQRRVGRDGREFDFPKFRSMVVDADARKASLAERNEADGPVFKMREDPRITPVGRLLRKSSLDEMPQLWCVLRGQMS